MSQTEEFSGVRWKVRRVGFAHQSTSIHYPTGAEGSGLKKRYTMVLLSSVRSHQFRFGEGVLLNELEEVTFVDAPWVIDAKRVQSEAISVRS